MATPRSTSPSKVGSRRTPETDLPQSVPSTPDNSAQNAQDGRGAGTVTGKLPASRGTGKNRDVEHPEQPAETSDDADQAEEVASSSDRNAGGDEPDESA